MDTTKGKKFWMNDPIHGHMDIPYYCMEFVDTPQFQRLRHIKQLGTTYYVFPGASHMRFEHSIGTCHVAGEMLKHLQSEQPELGISPRLNRLVRLAGLCHDLGHGPFSHAFEPWIQSIRPELSDWHHEDMSLKMLDWLVDDNHIDLDRADVRQIGDFINPDKNKEPSSFLYEIVSNPRNSVDVDKFDYLTRDCHNASIRAGFDSARLIQLSRVIDNEICYNRKDAKGVYELFMTRYDLHRAVYTHRVGKAVEFMIQDALTAADPVLRYSDRCSDPRQFFTLTDNVLCDIEYSTASELQAARDLVGRLRKRNLYKLACERVLIPGEWEHFQSITTEELASSGEGLHPNDLIYNVRVLNFAMRNKNPVDSVHFFDWKDPDKKFTVPKEEVSSMIPNQFIEHTLQVFVRDLSKLPAACKAFEKVIRKRSPTPC